MDTNREALVGAADAGAAAGAAFAFKSAGTDSKLTKVAILVTEGFEEVELTGPRGALDEAGARTMIVSSKEGTVRSWRFTEWGSDFPVDTPLGGASADDFDALLLPGSDQPGQASHDR